MHISTVAMLATQLLVGAVAAKNCVNMTVPVTINARNAKFGKLATPVTNIDASAFALAGSMQGVNGTEEVATGFQNIKGTYNISAKYCMPAKSKSNDMLQIMTHGIGFDKTYWDLAYNNFNYSYIDVALADGYHTVTYDRLGIGLSSHGDPVNVIQIQAEVQALAHLTRKLRKGNFPGVSTSFKKIIHVGHSFGSAQTYLLTAMYPTISDGIVLTGFSTNSSFVPLFTAGNDFVQARLNQPLRFGSPKIIDQATAFVDAFDLNDFLAPIDLTTLPKPLDYPFGYLIQSNSGATTYLFLLPPYFDPGILEFAEASKQPVTPGEALTLTSLPTKSTFKGPVLIVTGSNDVPFCGGNCAGTGDPKLASIPAAASAAFPKAETFHAHLVPDSGHGINFHYNAKSAYNYIQKWLGKNNL